VNLSTYLIILFQLLVSVTWAVDLEIRCKNQELISTDIIKNEKSERACEYFKDHGLACFDTSKNLSSSKKMSFFMPVDTVYQNRSSNQVSRNDIEEIVELSLLNGVDPYMTTAVKFIESPSSVNDSNNYYPRIFGLLPTDAIAAQASMGCISNDKSLEKKKDREKILILPNADSVGTFCLLNDTPDSADNPVLGFTNAKLDVVIEPNTPLRNAGLTFRDVSTFQEKNKVEDFYDAKDAFLKDRSQRINSDPKGCCTKVKYSSKEDPKKLFTHFRSLLGIKYIKDKTEKMPRSIAAKASNDRERAAFAIQSFNGYGKLNITERVNNKCLDGLDMKEKPLYGAGAMDLVTNLLLVNTGFNEIIEEKKKKLGLKSVPFYLCHDKNESFTMDSLAFAKLQKEYLSEQKECPERSFDYFYSKVKKPKVIPKKKGLK